MIAIIDYGVGNLFSLKSSLAQLGQDTVVTADPDTIRKADRLILPGVGAFADAMAKRQHNDLTVMLSHMPCLEASLQSESSTAIFSEADLILSGHNLGGQYCLPFIGALHADNDMLPRGGWFPAEEYLSGLHEVNATYQYVSTGLGAAHRTPFRFRLWNAPQISLIKLTRKLDA